MDIPGLDHSLVDGQWVRSSRVDWGQAPGKPNPEPLPTAAAPELSADTTTAHWVEIYWVKDSYWYYRYCYMKGRRICHRHIPGGNSSSGAAQSRAAQVRSMIADGATPELIEQQIQAWRKGIK